MTTQLLIFPTARRTDPDTSHQAAASMVHIAGLQAREVLEALRRYGSMTYTEIASLAGLEPHAVGRRLSELRRLELVERLSETRVTPSGRAAHVYRVMP
jgi:predicted ArsR family transcriptional regulator